jgi:probable F420-dependent oxidoreductase
MKLGIFAFPTDLSLGVVPLAREVEERGWHSLWLPDHSHIPTARTTPPGGLKSDRPLLEEYKRNIDLFCGLSAAAAVTERILLGTGVCLVAQRDPFWTAKEAATVDLLSNGRLRLGIGFGWNREEMAHHGLSFGTRRAKGREHVLAMKALWTEEEASFSGEHVRFESSWAWPKPVQAPHPPVWLGGAAVHGLLDHVVEYGDGWMPIYRDANQGAVDQLQRACEAAGRDPATVTLGVYAPYPDVEHLEGLAGLGFEWAALLVRPHPAADERRKLDEYQHLVDHFGASV